MGSSVVIVHEPTSQYVGPGFTLCPRADALVFDDAEVAARLLARHASEPCFAVVPHDCADAA